MLETEPASWQCLVGRKELRNMQGVSQSSGADLSMVILLMAYACADVQIGTSCEHSV